MRAFLPLISLAALAGLLTGCQSPQPAERPASYPVESPTVVSLVPTATPVATPTSTPMVVSTPTPVPVDVKQDVYEVFLRGSLLQQEGRNEEAVAVYREGLALAPGSIVLRLQACEGLRRLGRYTEAIGLAEPLTRIDNPDEEVLRLLGRLYAHDRQWDKALPYYDRLLTLNPASVETRLDLINIHLARNNPEEAVSHYLKLAEIDPVREAEYRFQAAMRLTAIQDYEEALAQYERLAELLDDYSDIYLRMGDLLGLLGRPEEAINAYLTGLSRSDSGTDEIRIRHRLGLLYRERGSDQEALYQYERIKELNPSDTQALQFLADYFAESGDYERALEELDAQLDVKPTSHALHTARRDVLMAMNREVEAYRDLLQALRRVLQSGPVPEANLFLLDLADPSAIERLEALNLRHRLDDILQPADREPITPRVHFARARLLLNPEVPDALLPTLQTVLEALNRAIANDEADRVQRLCLELQVWYDVRRAFSREGMGVALVEVLQAAKEHYPRQPQIARTLAMVWMDQHEWSAAVRVLEEARADLQTSHPLYRPMGLQLASAHERLGRLSEVETVLRELIGMNPRDDVALNFLGYTFADHDMNLDEALDLIQRALRIRPNDGNYMDSLGWVYYRMGRMDDAIRELERAHERLGEHPVILDHLGDAYQQVGRSEDARDCWERALNAGPAYPFEFTPKLERSLKEKLSLP